MTAHACHVPGCSREVPPRRLMCLAHWRLVPVTLQKRVWSAFVPGQEERKDPSPAYLAAAGAAVRAVVGARDLAASNGRNFAANAFRSAVEGCDLLSAETGALAEPLFKSRN